ncbi:MAG: DUF4830 domain-containing protein [Ruminococcaceae bacterium]|nr:DUF4830 domain-containing protein [Oscillospiraceae bacterium]
MFVRSIRMATIRLVSIAALAVLAIAALVIFIPSNDAPVVSDVAKNSEIRFDKIKTDEDRVNFLSQFGYAVDASPIESVEVTIPKNFDKVFAAYNELQKGEGLDLGRYKGKSVMRYTYKVTNYDGYSDTVYANLLVYKNKVIGADICSADPSGFAHGLKKSA